MKINKIPTITTISFVEISLVSTYRCTFDIKGFGKLSRKYAFLKGAMTYRIVRKKERKKMSEYGV